MNLRETKLYFEDIFFSKWNETPIHYAGQEFDGASVKQWVNPTYKPLRSTPNGISDSTDVSMGVLYIVCWHDTDGEVMELGDTVIDFIKANVDGKLFRRRGHEVIDHGWGDSNKVFIVLSFTFEQFDGAC